MNMTLKNKIFNILKAKNPKLANEWDLLYKDSDEPAIEIQRINEFWRWQFADHLVNSVDIRTWLNDDVTEEQWLRVFEEHLMPTIVQYELPKPLNL